MDTSDRDANQGGKQVPWGDGVLDAYLDGELDDTEREAVERYLLADAEAAAYVRSGRLIRQDLHRLFDKRLEAPLPPQHVELGLAIERASQGNEIRQGYRADWLRLPLQLAAAAVFAVVMLGAIAVGLRAVIGGPADQDLFALFSTGQGDDAATVQQVSDDGSAADATTTVLEDGTAEPAAPGHGAPDFSVFGFNLVGARLLSESDESAMQLVYESEAGRRVELFYSPDAESSETSLTVMEEGLVSALFWRTAGRSYSLIGDVPRDLILEMGRVVDGEWTVPLPSQAAGGASEADGLGADDTDASAATGDGDTEEIPAAGGESL